MSSKKDVEITINKRDRVKKNITTMAIYNALFSDNKKKNKALVSITIGDEKLNSLFELRKILMKKLGEIMRLKRNRNNTVAYFTNIELGASKGELTSQFNPHLHIQFFYSEYKPIEEALVYAKKKLQATGKEFENFDCMVADNNKAYMGYIIKEYVIANYNSEYEINKKRLGQGKPLYTASRKEINNYVIKYIYSQLSKGIPTKWKALKYDKRYEFILKLIKQGEIKVVKDTGSLSSEYVVVKTKGVYINIININSTIKNTNKGASK